MKRILAVLLAGMIVLLCTGCADNSETVTDVTEEEEIIEVEPQLSQIRSICKLAVMECYYHNVAKFKEENAEQFLWITRDKEFWVEYSGVVKLGIDVSQVTMEVNDNQVTIAIPETEVLSCLVDSESLTTDSYIVAKDSVEVTAEDEVYALSQAQEELEAYVAQDQTLLLQAQQRAQTLLENYVNSIGELTGKQYKITWVYLENGDNTETADAEQESGSEVDGVKETGADNED